MNVRIRVRLPSHGVLEDGGDEGGKGGEEGGKEEGGRREGEVGGGKCDEEERDYKGAVKKQQAMRT